MNSYVCIIHQRLNRIHQRLNRSQGNESGREGERKEKRGTERKKEGRKWGVKDGGWRKDKEAKEAIPLGGGGGGFSTIFWLDKDPWVWNCTALIAVTKSSSEERHPKVFETRLQPPLVIWFCKKHTCWQIIFNSKKRSGSYGNFNLFQGWDGKESIHDTSY